LWKATAHACARSRGRPNARPTTRRPARPAAPPAGGHANSRANTRHRPGSGDHREAPAPGRSRASPRPRPPLPLRSTRNSTGGRRRSSEEMGGGRLHLRLVTASISGRHTTRNDAPDKDDIEADGDAARWTASCPHGLDELRSPTSPPALLLIDLKKKEQNHQPRAQPIPSLNDAQERPDPETEWRSTLRYLQNRFRVSERRACMLTSQHRAAKNLVEMEAPETAAITNTGSNGSSFEPAAARRYRGGSSLRGRPIPWEPAWLLALSVSLDPSRRREAVPLPSHPRQAVAEGNSNDRLLAAASRSAPGAECRSAAGAKAARALAAAGPFGVRRSPTSRL
jgi:hypothetical protein